MSTRVVVHSAVFMLGCVVSTGCSSGATDHASPSPGDAAVGSNPNPTASDLAATQGATGGAAQPDAGSSTPLVNPAPGSKLFIGANFWNIGWEGQGDFFTSGVDFATTTNPWRPDLLTDLAPYSVLRFMDWNNINASTNTQATWSTRKQKTDAQDSVPVAYEWQIDLCNRAKKDYWLNIASQSTADDWMKLAQLVHDTLDPSLRVYVEWSNEVWNGGFPQNAAASSQAKTLGLAGSDGAGSYDVYMSVRVWESFESIFGKGSPRLVKVIAGQAAYTGPCTAEIAAFQDPKINPNGTKADVFAIAPYFAGTSISALGMAVTQAAQWTTSSLACAKTGSLPLVSYEGGSDSFSGDCSALQVDPGMHDLYTSYLDTQATAGMTGPLMQYTHTGACWGLKVKTGDSAASSPKYKGVTDWLAAHP